MKEQKSARTGAFPLVEQDSRRSNQLFITLVACISSKRSFVYYQHASVVYHQVAGKYTFGDDIHAKA